MIKFIIPLITFLTINPSYAEIYKWIDNQGVVHFSDEPHPGAETVTLPPMPTSSPPASTTQSTDKTVTGATATTDGDHEYKSVEISQPKNDSTLRNNQGYVSIIVNIEPDLQTGDKLQLLFDGRALGKAQTGKVFTLNNVNRGAHTLVAQIIDADGDVLNTSEQVTFYMQRPRVGMVPNTRPANTP